MKKSYIQPSLFIERVAIQQMICTSDPTAGVDTTSTVDADKLDSRRTFSVWGDDDEE